MCGWIVSELALSSRSAVAQVPSHFERGFQHETKVVSHRVRAGIWKQKDVPNPRMVLQSISGWTPFLFFAPVATSGTRRQHAVVLGERLAPPRREAPRDRSINMFVDGGTGKLKRN